MSMVNGQIFNTHSRKETVSETYPALHRSDLISAGLPIFYRPFSEPVRDCDSVIKRGIELVVYNPKYIPLQTSDIVRNLLDLGFLEVRVRLDYCEIHNHSSEIYITLSPEHLRTRGYSVSSKILNRLAMDKFWSKTEGPFVHYRMGVDDFKKALVTGVVDNNPSINKDNIDLYQAFIVTTQFNDIFFNSPPPAFNVLGIVEDLERTVMASELASQVDQPKMHSFDLFQNFDANSIAAAAFDDLVVPKNAVIHHPANYLRDQFKFPNPGMRFRERVIPFPPLKNIEEDDENFADTCD